MFGCLIAGRPLLPPSSLTQIDETHAYFSLTYASTINHIALFITGDTPFPPGYGASVHFFWPGKGFQVLGMLSNDKPSAIFRLRGTFSSGVGAEAQGARAQGLFAGAGQGMDTSEDVTAILGLAIEPLEAIQAQLPQASAGTATPSTMALVKPPSLSDAVVLAEKTVKHLINYLSGFVSGGGDVLVPMSAITRWYEIFVGKIRSSGNLGFLENID